MIDGAKQRLTGSEESYTFHGRDLFAYVGARLASGKLAFKDVGPKAIADVVWLAYQPAMVSDGVLRGNFPVLDVQYGNVWSDIPKELFNQLSPRFGESFAVTVRCSGTHIWSGTMPYGATFGAAAPGGPVLRVDSRFEVAIAPDEGNLAAKHRVASGPGWSLEIRRPEKR